jgi:bifunctional non-homologous end joining protein LigD
MRAGAVEPRGAARGRDDPELTVRVETEFDGRVVALTNLDRVMWPAAGLTKQWLIDYYVTVADALLPHVAARPLTLARFPAGVDGPGFVQNECRGRPSWMRVQPLRLRDGTVRTYCVVGDLPSLVWVANLGAVELHPYLSKNGQDSPSAVVFDLDPQDGSAPIDAWRVALAVRDRLARHGLDAFAKTSGVAGVHVFAPLNSPHTFAHTRAFARALAEELATADPANVSASTKPRERAGCVFIDWLQNDPRRSTVAPYSLRATGLPGVSTPVAWSEVEEVVAGRADIPWFTPAQVLDRLTGGDLFAGVLEVRQQLPDRI